MSTSLIVGSQLPRLQKALAVGIVGGDVVEEGSKVSVLVQLLAAGVLYERHCRPDCARER